MDGYGIEYWKIRTLMHLACDHVDQGNQEAEAPALRFLAKYVALEAAIVEVCKLAKVDLRQSRQWRVVLMTMLSRKHWRMPVLTWLSNIPTWLQACLLVSNYRNRFSY